MNDNKDNKKDKNVDNGKNDKNDKIIDDNINKNKFMGYLIDNLSQISNLHYYNCFFFKRKLC